jgi:hypothetical protein
VKLDFGARMVGDQTVWSWRGHAAPEILACGHSHRLAMMAAICEQEIDPAIRAAVLAHGTPGPKPADEMYWGTVLETPGNLPLAVLWEGNVHNRFLFKPAEGFRLAYKNSLLSSDDRELIVAIEMVRASFMFMMGKLDLILHRIKKQRKLLVVGTPPPKQERWIRNGLVQEPGYVERAAQQGFDIETIPITPLALRIQLWGITQDMLAESAVRFGVEFVPVPDSVKDADGALRDELCMPDATHANARYGALMWKEIYAKVRR